MLFYIFKFTCINFCVCCLKSCNDIGGKERYRLTYSDDFYDEINFVDLFKEFKKTRNEKKIILNKIKSEEASLKYKEDLEILIKKLNRR